MSAAFIHFNRETKPAPERRYHSDLPDLKVEVVGLAWSYLINTKSHFLVQAPGHGRSTELHVMLGRFSVDSIHDTAPDWVICTL